ncbi:hypothetical protein DVH05_017923 [Phytophthora capsici]|nr:hypothetical protein DVH05_017923 [Phytophthora capsici]
MSGWRSHTSSLAFNNSSVPDELSEDQRQEMQTELDPMVDNGEWWLLFANFCRYIETDDAFPAQDSRLGLNWRLDER